MNKYYLRARLFPTLITSIPLVFFINQLVGNFFLEQYNDISKLVPSLTIAGLSAAFVFLLVQVNRLIAKEVFQRWYFQDEMNMPTTRYLLISDNSLDMAIKMRIRSKINSDFHFQLLDADQERDDNLNARKLIVTSVSQIRNRLRDNQILLQHNIEYGFFRNLLGGSLLAFIISLMLLFYSVSISNSSLQYAGIVLCVIYLIIILFGKTFVNRYGHYYAKILFEQYLSV